MRYAWAVHSGDVRTVHYPLPSGYSAAACWVSSVWLVAGD